MLEIHVIQGNLRSLLSLVEIFIWIDYYLLFSEFRLDQDSQYHLRIQDWHTTESIRSWVPPLMKL